MQREGIGFRPCPRVRIGIHRGDNAMNTARNLNATAAHPLRSHIYRDVARLAGEALAAGFVITLSLAPAIFIVATRAAPAESGAPGQGTLMLRSGSGDAPVAAPLLFT